MDSIDRLRSGAWFTILFVVSGCGGSPPSRVSSEADALNVERLRARAPRLLRSTSHPFLRAADPIQCSGLIAYPPCPEGMFCEITVANACNGADLPGYCQPTPEVCDELFDPVCGCDGKTYGNDCFRRGAGVQLDHAGECAAAADDGGTGRGVPDGGDGMACGGLQGLACAEGAWCRFAPEALCGAADATGTCVPKQDIVCTEVFDPVCGCDGRNYSNACHADAAQVSVAHTGACEIQRIPVEQLEADPATFDGVRIEVVAAPHADSARCTLRACSVKNACCNICDADFVIGNAIVLEQASGAAIGCNGNECTWRTSCQPFSAAQGNGTYLFQGVFHVQDGRSTLVINDFRPIGG